MGLNVLEVMKAVFGMEVDQSGLERGLKEAERKVEDTTQTVEKKFNKMGLAIATGVSVAVVAAMAKAIEKTAKWGEEIENLSHRMAMTAEETSTMIGVMERFGIGAQIGAMTMTRLSMGVKQTTEALDPFNTRLGRLFGSLRDTSGQALNLSQVFDLARQKVAGASSELEKLQIATAIAGPRMGGKMLEVLQLNNAEWAKYQQQVKDAGIVTSTEMAKMSEEYEHALAGIRQDMRGLSIAFGKEMLPAVMAIVEPLGRIIEAITRFTNQHDDLTRITLVIAAIVAPIMSIAGAWAFHNQILRPTLALLREIGFGFVSVNRALAQSTELMGAHAVQEEASTVATRAHTSAIRDQTAALLVNSEAGGLDTGFGALMGQAGKGAAAGAGGAAGRMIGGIALGTIGSVVGVVLTAIAAYGILNQITSTLLASHYKSSENKEYDVNMEYMRTHGGSKENLDRVAVAKGVDPVILDKQIKASTEMAKALKGAAALGIEAARSSQDAATAELVLLEKKRALLEGELKGNLSPEQRTDLESKLLNTRIQSAKLLQDLANQGYQQEELQLKAQGMFASEAEMKLLEEKLNDERIVGDERLKLEATLYDKRKKYAEDAVAVARKLGILSTQDEMQFRKQRVTESLGKGDILGAANDMVQLRTMAQQQADQINQVMKLMRVTSLKDEIQFQMEKLQLAKGNADEEIKILQSIAATDKELYETRKSFALDYFGSIRKGYEDSQKIGHGGGEQFSLEQMRRGGRESEFEIAEQTRNYRDVLHGGGMEDIQASSKWAQEVQKSAESLQKMGESLTSAETGRLDLANTILQRLTGLDQRAPGQPSPVVGSITSSSEGLATSNLAKGSEIPRLDTSYTDLSIRIRDVLLGVIPNVTAFGTAIAEVTRGITGRGLTQINFPPGNEQRQFQPPLPVSPNSLAQPTGGQQGEPITLTGPNGDTTILVRRVGDLLEAIPFKISSGISDALSKVGDDIASKVSEANAKGGGTMEHVITFDPSTGQFLAEDVVKRIATQLK